MFRSCLLLTLLVAPPVAADERVAYRKPPADIVRILEAPPLPDVSVHPARTHLLFLERQSLPPLEDLARPMWRLAGLRINPRTHGPHGARRHVGLQILEITRDETRRVALPEGVDVGRPAWSPDGKRFAFTITRQDRIELWVGETASGAARRIDVPPLNAVLGSAFRWFPDSRRLLARVIAAKSGAAPERPLVPPGPAVRESSGKVSPVRTYQDLLKDAHDEALFEYVTRAELMVVDLDSGDRVTRIGEPASYETFEPAPGGDYILVSRLTRPYSYMVGSWYFPEVVEIRDATGKVVHALAKLPLRDDVPIRGVPRGPREFGWRSTAPATLYWVEALDGGDPKKKVPHRDRVLSLAAPFDGKARQVLKTEHRFRDLSWLDRDDLALVREYDWERRWTRTWLAHVDDTDKPPRLLWDRSLHDRYGDAGRPVTVSLSSGFPAIGVHEGSIFLSGDGASAEGDRPFVDRLDLQSFETRRLWRCGAGTYERLVAVLSEDPVRLLTRRETRVEPPNYHVRDLAGNRRKAITHFEHPAPELREIQKRLITYERADGVQLSATLYLPPGYREGRLPLIVWAYPREYSDPGVAGQIRGSPHRFTLMSGTSHLFLLTRGYAVLDGAAMPIVGDPETANDTFVQQLVASARAAIDKVVAMGVADPGRVGIGGHSYGAFMTANLLAHSDLFRAGIARSGAYNRSLTPFGFQNERRTFWEAPEIYFKMSPFMHADKINEPILLIHGERDNNSGTFPIQSERLYHALKGHGARARLVLLPYESHGYRARESVMHVVAEMVDWFDRHLKGPATTPSRQRGG